MRKDMFTIIKKELARFFGDTSMVFSVVLLPGVLIYVLYSFMGQGMMKSLYTDDTYVAKAYVQNLPEELAPAFEQLSAEWTEISDGEVEEVKTAVQEQEADVLVVFPEDFSAEVAAYDVTTGEEAPQVAIYYNAISSESDNMEGILTQLLAAYENTMANKFDVNGGEERYNLASEKDMTGMIFSLMMPLLIMMFLFSGCMSVAPESIAGEKERGTIATLLVTPMKRSALALGKITSLSCISLLAGISSFVGTMLSLPNLMGGEQSGMSANAYVVSDYLLLLGIILSTVLVLVALISLISAMSKSVKAASTAVTPLMIVVMVISILPMMGMGKDKLLATFFIPLYNSVQCMDGIFSFSYEPMQMVITIVINLVFAGVLTFVLTKLFDSEKVMFAK